MPVLTPTQAAHAVASLTITDFINTALHAHNLEAEAERLWQAFIDAPPMSDESHDAHRRWQTANQTVKATFAFLDETWAQLAPNVEHLSGVVNGQAVLARRKVGYGVLVRVLTAPA